MPGMKRKTVEKYTAQSMEQYGHMSTANLLLVGLMFGPEYSGYFGSLVFYLTILGQGSRLSIVKMQVDALFFVASLGDIEGCDWFEKLVEQFLLPLESGEAQNIVAKEILHELHDVSLCSDAEGITFVKAVIQRATIILWPVVNDSDKQELHERMEDLLQD